MKGFRDNPHHGTCTLGAAAGEGGRRSRRAAAPRAPLFWAAPEYRASLAAAGLLDFDAVMSSTLGRPLRVRRDRENWRLELPGNDGQVLPAYLKKHRHRVHRARWYAVGQRRGPVSEGRNEAEFIRSLPLHGVPTMPLVAYGECLESDGLLQSFVLTRELSGFVPLDDFLLARFPTPGRYQRRDLDRLIDAVADLAGRFHAHGHNHRDFYTCHFFVREPEPGRFDVHLIDLQRVQLRVRFRRRWIVKDLAQLAYSSPAHCITCRERLRFFKRWLGVRKLKPAHRRWLRSVLWRELWMRRKLGPYR